MSVTYVSPEEFEAMINRLDVRRAAVAKALRDLKKAQTMAEKVAAKRALKIAQSMPV